MPYIHIQLSGDADAALAGRVASLATDLTSKLLRKDPLLTAVVVDFVDPARWFVAGRALAGAKERSYHWTVSITDETNTRSQKSAYLEAVHASMKKLLGDVAEHSYVHVADLRASAYGFGGRSQEFRYQHAMPAARLEPEAA